MANQEHKKNKNTNHKGRNADPSARYALRHSAEKQSKSERRRTQQKQPQPRFAMDTAVKSTVSQLTKRCTKPRKVKHAFIVVADRQQRKALAVH